METEAKPDAPEDISPREIDPRNLMPAINWDQKYGKRKRIKHVEKIIVIAFAK